MWLALDTYVILADAFTWDSFANINEKYYSLPWVYDDNLKLDVWAREYSKTVNTNLCSFFEWWGWNITADTKYVCSKLPAWNLDPMKRFTRKLFL
jgi:hypothetical protein